ncbi:hypothetical protein HPB48_005353 [Haemaphysalis longicornis]|uniref:BZIP domain-containing protein n=1 Tax=Haemaphysalis longicornis TaxID=44386 RepID=A0A9J6GI95_HAELO|nr:hypothetical protein HPB48_005353 [Haemaphysalis longicornis]
MRGGRTFARTCALRPTTNGARRAGKRSRDLNTTARPPASSAGTVTSLYQRTVPPNLDIADQGQCATAAPTKAPTREAPVTTGPQAWNDSYSINEKDAERSRETRAEGTPNRTQRTRQQRDHTKALKAENIELKRELEQLRQEIRTIKAERIA